MSEALVTSEKELSMVATVEDPTLVCRVPSSRAFSIGCGFPGKGLPGRVFGMGYGI